MNNRQDKEVKGHVVKEKDEGQDVSTPGVL